MRKLLVLLLIAACGAKPAQPQVPMLPGDGDTHVAKPVEVVPPPAADPWSARKDLIAAPAPRAPAPLALPKIEEFKLSNGLAVYVVKNDRLPVMALQLAVRAGRMHEPRARLGVAELTADMLVKGTKLHDAAALARTIDFVGGTIAADSTFEATLVSCSVLTRSANTCFELVPEIITQPAFPEAELARLRDNLAGSLRQRFDDPATLASAHAQNLLWGSEHVRGWINNEQAIEALHREDLIAWHRAWFVPGNAMLVITGDVDVKKLKPDLERTFGVWKKGPIPPTPTYQEPGLSGSRIRLIDKPGVSQTQIRIAQFGIKHDDPRFFDTLVWNYVLGGSGAGSRLVKAQRDAGGEVYGASSSFDRNLDRGSFVASTVVRSPAAVATAKLMLGELAKMAKDGPTQDEVAAAVANIAGSYALRFQTASDIGAALIGAELHGFGYEYLTNFPIAVGGVELADARRAAAEILDPKAYVLVLVGDAKDLEPQLKRAGWRYETVAFSTPITASVGPDSAAPAPPAPPVKPIDPAAAAAAKKLIGEALAAKGGKAKLAAIKGIRVVSTGTTTIQNQTMPVEISRVLVVPDKMRIDAKIRPPGAPRDVEVTVGAQDKTGWQRGPDPKTGTYAVTDMTGESLSDVDFERWREPELILLKASEPGARLEPQPDDAIDGKPYSVVSLATPFGIAVSLYIDKQTKLIGRMSYHDSHTSESDDFADYRDVHGVKLAYKRTSTGDGRSTTLEVKTIELDPKVDPALFAKPAPSIGPPGGVPGGAPGRPPPATPPPATSPSGK
ncbi:MAG TPA: pitrilysin family protein [Kofleriaceae bacterium]|nr:pitrilysin family protein [Kofleriaceae bacterium]